MKKKVFREKYNEVVEPKIIEVEVKAKPIKMKKATDYIEPEDMEVSYELKPKKTSKKKEEK